MRSRITAAAKSWPSISKEPVASRWEFTRRALRRCGRSRCPLRPSVHDLQSALAQLKADNPCADIAAGTGVRLRRHGKGMIGPCPIYTKDRASKTDGRFKIKDRDGWVCAACQAGGDVIALVMQVEGLDFKGAIERLGGVREIDPAAVAQRDAERDAAAMQRDKDAAIYRERERGTLYDIWNRAVPPAGTAVEAYLQKRSLVLPPEAPKRLRCVLDMPYFDHGGKVAAVIHRGPAMVAPIVRCDGKFSGMHFTSIDLGQPNGKAKIFDPETGEALPAKKVRGSKAGGAIQLVKPRAMTRLVIGEGIETTLSVWRALASLGRDIAGMGFWSAVDLGNLGGKGCGHSDTSNAQGCRRQGTAGAWSGPRHDAIMISVPAEVEEIILLGDGDRTPS